MRVELAEIQGLVANGYGDRPCAGYAMFAITDAARARAWLGRVIDKLQFADFLMTERDEPPFLKAEPLNLAFTYAGFRKLGLLSGALAGFGPSFREGMAAEHRARQLGDDHGSAPRNWRWGGPHQAEIHGMLCGFAGTKDGTPDVDQRLGDVLRGHLCAENGLTLIQYLPAHPTQAKELRKEHFGFRDGVSNPQIEGIVRKPGRDTIKTGEVLLGYPNAYDRLGRTPRVRSCDDHGLRLPPSVEDPELRDFGKNGSYLVFRQLEQDVPAFWRFVERASAMLANGKDAVWLASRMVGRWPDGSPVTLFPERDSPAEATDINDFEFADHHDAFGERCPIGSHIRRTNPRDTMLPTPHDVELSGDPHDLKARKERVALTNVHRLLRRGRTYGTPLHPTLDPSQMREGDGQERGLYFLCFNANLRRQFEFVQASWIVNPNFAGLSDDPDPMLATQRDVPFPASDFTLQGCPAQRVRDVPRVVETRGGAYFFMPSRSALLFLSALETPCLERVAEGESADALALAALHVAKIQKDFNEQKAPKHAKRGFHAKCHGIVRATLEIERDLGPSFQAGVFQPGASYPAWVRFSSASFTPKADSTRDVHGLAIKLMGVPNEPRAALFEKQTQDFVLIDAPALMVGTVRQALDFDRAGVRGPLSLLWHLATHLDELLAIARITSAPRHLFERAYTSVTPFAHGPDRAVRYLVRLAADQRLRYSDSSDSSLRDSLRETLKQGELKLELCVQSRGLADLPTEDARVDWAVTAERIATLTLHPEGFDTPEQERFGEGLSFNPWNALEAHRPLGGLNRARRVVYRAVYELRSALNRRPLVEPVSHARNESE